MSNLGTKVTDWSGLPSGTLLQHCVQQQLDHLLWNRFGFHLLSLGPLAEGLSYHSSPTKLHCTLSSQHGSIIGQEERLPLRSDSIDVVILPLTLDFCADPYSLLREVQRVIIGDGHLLIVGLNPWSLWGARRYIGRRNHPLWQSRFLAKQRVTDWLRLLGFEVEEQQHFFYKPPLKTLRWQQRWEFVERLGAKAWPFAGACYSLCAQKREMPITPIRLRKPRLVSIPVGFPSPSRRERAA